MKHILIVDDDIHINKMLDEVLVHERYMVPMLTLVQKHYYFSRYKTRFDFARLNVTGIVWGRIITTNIRYSHYCYECKSRC